MFGFVVVALTVLVAQTGKPASLPDTPQGKHVEAYLRAFNTGDEKKFLAMMEDHLDPGLLKRRPAEERGKLFQRMKGDFGTLKVSRVLKATATQIQIAVPTTDGIEATFSFEFEPAAPFRITRLEVDLDRGPGEAQAAAGAAPPHLQAFTAAGVVRYHSMVRASPSSNVTLG